MEGNANVDTDEEVQDIITLFNGKIEAANKKIGEFKTDASTKLTTINDTITTINIKLQELLDGISTLEQAEKDNQAEIDSLTGQVADLTKEKEALKIQMEALQSELKKEQDKTAKLEGDIADNQSKLTLAEEAKTTAEQILAEKQEEHVKALEGKIDANKLEDIEAQNKEINDKLGKDIKEKDEEISNLTGKNKELTEKLEGATKKVDELNESTRLLQGAIGQAKSQSTGALQRLEEVQEANRKLTEELTKANDGLAAIKFAINNENVDVDLKGLLQQINEILIGVQETNQLVDKLTANPKKVNRVMSIVSNINSKTNDHTDEAKRIENNLEKEKGYDHVMPPPPTNLKKQNNNDNNSPNTRANGIVDINADNPKLTNFFKVGSETEIDGDPQNSEGGKRRKSKGKTRKVRKHATKKKRKPLLGGKKRKQTRKRRSRKAKKANKKK